MRFPRHPTALLLALALASLLWYAVALDRRERLSEKQVDASVTLVNVPADMVITSDVPRTVVLQVRGPLSQLRRIEPSQTEVTVDLRGAREGQREYPLEIDEVDFPDQVEVIAVSPATVPLRLEALVRKRVPVQPTVIGEPAPGFVVGAIVTDPPVVPVAGPRRVLEKLEKVTTEPVSVAGANASLQALAAIRSPDPLTRVEQPGPVRVQIGIIARLPEP